MSYYGGVVNYGKKKSHVGLLNLIQRHADDLYQLISDLCLEGTFRSERYENTFLMPNGALIKHLENLVENDKDAEAARIIRSLLLVGHVSESGFKKDAEIHTLQYGQVLADPAAVKSHIKKSEFQATNAKGDVIAIVYNYSGEAPKIAEGKEKAKKVSVGSKGGGNAADGDVMALRKLTAGLVTHGDQEATISNFFKAVAGALNLLEEGTEKYNRAKFYIAANPIVSWYLLTMPGHSNPLVSASELKNFNWAAVTDPEASIKAAKEADYTMSNDMLRKIKDKRSQMISGADRTTLIDNIKKHYDTLTAEAAKDKSIDEHLAKNVDLKILMDEQRFMYDSAVKTWSQVDDTLDAMRVINWGRPAEHHIICNKKTYTGLFKGSEAFVSGPLSFVKSVYFAYIPLSAAVEDQLSAIVGAGVGGVNPSTSNNVTYSGGSAKALSKKINKSSLVDIVKVLSKQQREQLKAML